MATKKRHRKFNYRFYILMIILIFLLLFMVYKGFYFLTTTKTERDLRKLNYSNEAITLIIDNKIDKYLINNDIYSKTLDVALTGGQYEKTLLEEYIYFPYKAYDNYIIQLNELSLMGYTRDDIKQVFNTLDQKGIDIVIKHNTLINNLAIYITDDYFDINNLNRYVEYKNDHQTYDYSKVISYVNMYHDYPYYEHTINVADPNDLLVIVNKYYKLENNFVPKDLVRIDTDYAVDNDRWVIPVVKENFELMASDMKKLDLHIQAKSAYRSYDTQVVLYNDYVKSNGREAADTFSARAGYSEHQTGLAIDVRAGSGTYGMFETSNEYKWMKDNAHKYGFILRYPSDKTDITGYKFESWHFRYVGKDIAKYIHENNLTFDEYYAMFIENKKD